MKEPGLQPSDTAAPGGKETGQNITHYIIPGLAFEKAFTKLEKAGFRLNRQSAPWSAEGKAKKASKTKYTCAECGQNAWAKPGASLNCGDCHEEDPRIDVSMAKRRF